MPFTKKYFQRLPLVIMILGFLLSGVIAWQAKKVSDSRDHQRFISLTEKLHDEITRRMSQFNYGLRGSAALWPASKDVTRLEFARMVGDRDLENEFKGALGIGFIRRVNRDNHDTFLAETRADYAPDFNIKTSGDHPDLYIIEFINPEDINQPAIGYDVGQEPNRRFAAEQAMLTGKPFITAPIKLLQAPDEGPGFLVFYPIYQKNATLSNEADRKKNLFGWTYMPIVASRVLEGVTSQVDEELDFEVFQGAKQTPENLIYDDDQHLKSTGKSSYSKVDYLGRSFREAKEIHITGQTWTLVCSTNTKFYRSSQSGFYTAGIGGVAITLLLSSLIYTLGRSKQKAEEIAQKITLELQESVKKAEMLAMVATQTSNSVIICDENRRITWVNEGFTRITGYTLEESLGKAPGKMLQSELSDPKVIDAMRVALDKGEPIHCEIINRSKSGEDYWLDISMVPIRNDKGFLTGFMSIQLDITERKKDEQRLKEQAERTSLALDAGELGLWDWEIVSGRTIYDERWAEMLGEKLEDLTPHVDEWIKRLHPNDSSNAQKILQQHLDGETPIYVYPHRLKHRDGSWRWIVGRGKIMLRGADRKPLRMVGTHQDITRRYAAQLEAERLIAALNHTGKLAKVGAWQLNIADQSLYWSDQVKRIHEVDDSYVPQLDAAYAFYPEGALETTRHVLEKAIREGTPYDVELPFITAKGNHLWVRTMGEALKVDGVTVAIRGAFQDITESHSQQIALAEAKKIAEQASHAKADFLANMSHEIRTPMNAVIGMTELLQHTPLNEEQQDFIGMIRSSGETLLVIINDILDYSKIESGNLELEHIPVHLRDCVENALEIVARPAAENGLDLLISIDQDIPLAIYADKVRLTQILTNLLSNAVKFTDSGQVLVSVSYASTIHGRLKNQGLHFAVSDTGIGIPADRLDRLFKSFSQVDASTTRQYGGTGLGLAICARLVKLMNGKIWVESTPGKGSVFHFEIPAKEAPCPPEVNTISPSNLIIGKRLLIVDDNPTNRQILSLHAQNWGLVPFTASSGSEALNWIDQGDHIDLAIIDVQMPEMDGYELAAEIRKRIDARKLPIMVLTSLGDAGKKFEGLDICRVLSKPTKSAALLEAIMRALNVPDSESTKPHVVTTNEPPLAALHPFRILLTEDLVINQRVAALILGRLGYTTEIAENGKVALELLEQHSFDIIFMDVQMPIMDGLTCTREICMKYPIQDRPWIIAMTAKAQEGDSKICLDAGMDDYISKPINGKAITHALLMASEGLLKRRAQI